MRRIVRVILMMVSAAALMSLGMPSAFAAVPTITSFSPSSGPAGCVVVITGTSFDNPNVTSVDISGTLATSFKIVSGTEIWATVGSGTTSGTIRVTNASGTANSATNFTVASPGGCAPTISSFTPTCGTTGTVVTIVGTNLLKDANMGGDVKFFDNTTATPTGGPVSPTQLSVLVPSGATTGPITVSTGVSPDASSSTNFTVSSSCGAAACSFVSGVLTVTSTSTGSIQFQVDAVDRILVNGASAIAACGATAEATTSNTSAINVSGDSADQAVIVLMNDTGGATISWGAINWTISLGGQSVMDSLTIDNSAGNLPLHVVLGSSGIDLNADANLDLVSSGVESFTVNGGFFDDTISAAGDATTGSAFDGGVTANGNAGNDLITGGNGNDRLNGGADADIIVGGPGDDPLDGGLGTSCFTCADEDVVDYSGSAAAVNMNLAIGVGSGQGLDVLLNFESAIGSSHNDSLTGNDGPNRFLGGAGSDLVSGLAGDDFLNGGLGKDSVDGGADTDTCVHGGDSFASCEVFVGGGPRRF